MGRAIGIGGIFIHLKGKSKDLFDWYEEYLGLDFSAYGTGFLEGEQLLTITFKRDDSEDMPLLNFRVDDIESIISKLKKNSIQIINDIEDFDYGKFARFMDPFGNPIELWEAKSNAYRKLVKEEIKKYKKTRIPKIEEVD
jgi:predicted enzyme related to lactoylglutathione lyase